MPSSEENHTVVRQPHIPNSLLQESQTILQMSKSKGLGALHTNLCRSDAFIRRKPHSSKAATHSQFSATGVTNHPANV